MRTWIPNNQGWLILLLVLVAVALGLIGCTANEPFDPNVLENAPPVARLFVEVPVEGEELNPTSYFRRTFNWSASDVDGWVTEFFVSIATEDGVPAPWVATQSTDTTMTFTPDPISGEASATVSVVCQDNRGAFSDTVSQFIPMRNHTPVVSFKSNFDPRQNMQRELVAEPDSFLYWNWGPTNFRIGLYDPDGLDTMDNHLRYTLADGDPEQEWDIGDPNADVETGWIRVSGLLGEESYEVELFVGHVAPGLRTLTISAQDEAGGDAWFQYQWEVRAPKNSILYFFDNSSGPGRDLYYAFLNETFGQDNWDEYDFVFGFPDHAFVLLETMKLFDVVLWSDGGSTTSGVMKRTFSRDGAMAQYLNDGGRLMLMSKLVTEPAPETGLSPVFIRTYLGINPTEALPRGDLQIPYGKRAMPAVEAPDMPVIYKAMAFGTGRGLDLLAYSEALYRLESCPRCYNDYDPWDPVVAYRRPPRLDDDLQPQNAHVIGYALQLEYFAQSQVIASMQHALSVEMGVTP